VHDEHIYPPHEQLSILQREARWTSYVVAFFETAMARLFETSAKRQAYLATMDRVVFELLAELKATLEKRDTRLLVVQTPDATAYATVSNWEHALVAPVRNHLLNIYEKLDIPYIDVMREFLRFDSFQDLYQHYFVTLPNGKRGHMSPRGNWQVARLIAERLCKPDFKGDAWPTSLTCDDLQLHSYQKIRLSEWRAMDTSDKVVDLGLYKFPGTIRGDVKVEQEGCRVNFCWVFDGHSSHVVVDSVPLLHLKTHFAIEAWVKQHDRSTDLSQGILVKGGAYSLSIRNGHPSFYAHGLTPDGWHISPVRLTLGKWHHVSAAYHDGNIIIRLDDRIVYRGKVEGNVRASSNPLWLGRGSGYFNGWIETVGLFSSAHDKRF
jgi:hypothetical protein